MLADSIGVMKTIGTEFSEKNVTFMAAGLAYNAFISLAPLLIVLLLAVSVVGGGLEDRILEIANTWMPGPIAEVIEDIFQDDDEASGASIIGMVVLIWGTLKIFRGLDTAFSEIYETTTENSFLDKFIDGIVVGIAILIAVLATVGVTAIFARLEGIIPYIGTITPLVLVAGLLVAFFPMYYRFPDVPVNWRMVLPGAAFAAIGWAAFQSIFQVYLTFAGDGSENFFGGVIIVITWLYFSGLVLLTGAIINAVIGGHTSGTAGGVGTGASDYTTEREEAYTKREISEYLEVLRTDLTTGPWGARTHTDAGGHRHYPLPHGRVKVIEQSKDLDSREEWSIALRWETANDAASSPERTDK